MRYSLEKVSRACTKASRHKSRSQKYGCTEHFTAWQWLDLCADHDFRCSYCGEAALLEPHHKRPLYRKGANTIENIQPLCRRCHLHFDNNPHDISKVWMEYQQMLFDSFQVGDRVKRSRHWPLKVATVIGFRQEGMVLQLFPAKRAWPPLRGTLLRCPPGQTARAGSALARGFYYSSGFDGYADKFVEAWEESAAKALVRWFQKAGRGEVAVSELLVDLSGIEKVKTKNSKPTKVKAENLNGDKD